MNKLKIDFVLFDLIGTTVKDLNKGESLILDIFHKAFSINGIEIDYDVLNQQRGKSKYQAINNILTVSGYDIEQTDKIYGDFIKLLNESLIYFKEIDGSLRLFSLLKERQIKVGIGSGLPMEFMKSIIKQVGWDINKFDYVGSSDSLGKGRPDPIMIFDSMHKLEITSTRQVLKVGDTFVDVQEGKNADVLTAMVLTGTQGVKELGDLKPDFILKDINELINII